MPYRITGKEWCKSQWLAQRGLERGISETGFSYFGARYYNSDLSGLFLSVDPMADKYPGISPYAYCAWNPVKLVDPDGEEISPIYDKWGNLLGTDDQGLKGKAIVMDEENFSQGMSHEIPVITLMIFWLRRLIN